MQPILDPCFLVEVIPAEAGGTVPAEYDPFGEDGDFFASELSGLAAFLTGAISVAAVEAAIARERQQRGMHELAALLDETRLGRAA